MRNIEARVKFAQECGHSLDFTNKLAEDCDSTYVAWLENQLSSWILSNQLVKDIQKVVKE